MVFDQKDGRDTDCAELAAEVATWHKDGFFLPLIIFTWAASNAHWRMSSTREELHF